MNRRDRALSDVLAFGLIFAVMVASVGLIGAVGFDTVTDVSEGEQLRSAELSMAEVGAQLAGIADHEAPVRSSELRVGGATVEVTDALTMTVSVSGSDNVTTWNETIELGAITYRLGDTTISVVGGAVVRLDDGNAVMLEEPPFLVTEETARLNLITVEPLRDPPSVSTEELIQLQSHHQRTRLLEPTNRSYLYDVETIEIELEGDGSLVEAWDAYFEAHPEWYETETGWGAPSADDGQQAAFEDGVIVRLSHVGIQFIR